MQVLQQQQTLNCTYPTVRTMLKLLLDLRYVSFALREPYSKDAGKTKKSKSGTTIS